MGLHVRIEKRSNKEISKAARATRSDHTTHMPRCPVGLHSLFLEIPKAKHHRSQQRSKSAPEKPKMGTQAARATPKSTKIRLNFVRGRSGPPLVAPGSAGNAPGRARNGRWTPSWVVLGAMLAVLGAMLAVWDAKLTARGAPRTLRSARGARLCRHSASETRSQRSHTRLVLRKPQFLQCFPPVWAILP